MPLPWPFSPSLFNPHSRLNYFDSPGFDIWWGEPTHWEIAVLIFAGICALAMALPLRPLRRTAFVTSAIGAPFIFGLFVAVLQIHLTFHSLGVSGWAAMFDPLSLVFFQLLASHIGLYCSVVLFLFWCAGAAFHRARKSYTG